MGLKFINPINAIPIVVIKIRPIMGLKLHHITTLLQIMFALKSDL